ncbi:hypothetical protein VTJ04DRAFT_6523 [Mycothermus thermophilus]|uniref:uncharacterized protein n=1 Tax=Humicola insolens TaxID=85995 RepID=UPI0037444BDC
MAVLEDFALFLGSIIGGLTHRRRFIPNLSGRSSMDVDGLGADSNLMVNQFMIIVRLPSSLSRRSDHISVAEHNVSLSCRARTLKMCYAIASDHDAPWHFAGRLTGSF